MKKTVILIMAAVTAALFLAGCGQKNVITYARPPVNAPTGGDSWTVLIYMMGGARETGGGDSSEKLYEIARSKHGASVHIAVETGGSSAWHAKGVYNDYLQRFEAAGDGKLYLADQMQTVNMGDYRTLTDFITWGTEQYKSDKYMLIISGTGGGSMYGVGSDEQYGNDCLTMEEISYGLSVAGTKFDVVGMDASLMGSLETATALSTYADYLVAPQDIINSDSWDYRHVLEYLGENPDADGRDVGKEICDSYYERASHAGGEKYAAMSVIDTSKVTTLNQAFDGMAGDMLVASESLDSLKNLMGALRTVHIYGGATAEEGWSDLADIGDMAVKCSEFTGMTSDMLIDALNDAIVYSVRGSMQKNATGLSTYYPEDRDPTRLQLYMDMSHGSKYKEFLRKICINCDVSDSITNTSDYTSSWAWTTYNNDMAWLEYQSILDGSSYELHVTGNMDLFSDIALNVYKYSGKTNQYVFVGKYTDIASDWESGIFRAGMNISSPKFGASSVGMRLIRHYDEYDLYSVPVVVNGELSSIRVTYADGEYEILGCQKSLDENGQADGVMRKLKPMDRIVPVLSVYNEHSAPSYILGASQRKTWNAVSSDKLDDGKYMLEFVMTDIYGLERYGVPVEAKISGGKMSLR